MPVTPGQFAVMATNDFVGRVIRWATRSTVNHAILCVGPDGACVEAAIHGVRRVSANAYPTAIWSDEALTPAQVAVITGYGTSHIGEEYGLITIAAITLELLHFRPRWVLRLLRDRDSVICSELVALAYEAAHIVLDPYEDPGRVRPDQLLLAAIQSDHAKN